MLSSLLRMIIGWPGIITSLILSFLGIMFRRYIFLVYGALAAVPISMYLSATPRFRYFMVLLPLFQFGAAFAVHKGNIKLAWLLFLPFLFTVSWLAVAVLSQ
ncbi:MAG: hypothetical protein ACOYVD_09505 [Bacillota bacterium]